MDILVITWNYPPRRGGIENLISNLCNGLRSTSSVFVVTSYARNACRERDTFRAPLPGLLPFAFYALWRSALLLFGNPGVRVVFGGSALVAPLVLFIARVFRRRAIVLTHGLDVVYRRPLYQQLCVRWLKFCDRVVANSTYTAELAQSKGITGKRLSVITPGVDADHFDTPTDIVATKRQWDLENKKIILFVGRLARRKGVKEFIENCFVSVLEKVPEAVFLIVGDNPTESLTHRDDVVSRIKEAVSELGLKKHVRLLGSIRDENLIKLYQACDVVVLPALRIEDDVEGFGIVALEAAAAGKPVVATRVGGIPDAIEDGKSGILVEPGDYEGFSRVITTLLKDRQSRLIKGRYGQCRVKQEFSWVRVIARYEDVFADARQ